MQRALWVLLVLLGMVSLGQAATVTNLVSGTLDTWLSVNTSTANGAGAVTATAVTATNPTYRKVDCVLNVPAFTGTVAANGNAVGWFITSLDGGTIYEDGTASVFPTRLPDVNFPLRAVSTAQVVSAVGLDMPRGSFKLLIRNQTGAALNGAGGAWTVKCKTYTESVN